MPVCLAAAVLRLAWDPCFPYLVGAVLLVSGLISARRSQTLQTGTLEKVIALGPVFMAVPFAVFGADHLIFPESVARIVPSWIPAHLFWVYFLGACLISGSLSLVVRKYDGLAAALFGTMLFLFVLLIHIPNVVGSPHDRILWAVALRDLAFSGGALSLAATYAGTGGSRSTRTLSIVGRLFLGIPIVFFAVEHLLHPEFAPGVPLRMLTPLWIPAHLLWSYLTGAVYTVTGLSLIFNKQPRLAATWLGLMVLLVVLLIYVPATIANPGIGTGLNPLVDTLLLSGSALCVAAAQRKNPLTQPA